MEGSCTATLPIDVTNGHELITACENDGRNWWNERCHSLPVRLSAVLNRFCGITVDELEGGIGSLQSVLKVLSTRLRVKCRDAVIPPPTQNRQFYRRRHQRQIWRPRG
jgi:hypothetical protein